MTFKEKFQKARRDLQQFVKENQEVVVLVGSAAAGIIWCKYLQKIFSNNAPAVEDIACNCDELSGIIGRLFLQGDIRVTELADHKIYVAKGK